MFKRPVRDLAASPKVWMNASTLFALYIAFKMVIMPWIMHELEVDRAASEQKIKQQKENLQDLRDAQAVERGGTATNRLEQENLAFKPELTRNARDGDAEAQFHLGLKHAKGEGVPQDTVEAVNWYRKAAKQGHGKARNALIRMAIDRDDADMQYYLGEMYARGYGVPEDPVEAFAWYNLALDHDHMNALDCIVDLRLDMPHEEISQGEERAAQILKLIKRRQPK